MSTITPADEYPIHLSPEPIAAPSNNPNAYDRFFFNGYTADGSVFFALAMGFYPGRGVVDAAFCVQRDGVQHNVRASKSAPLLDRMDLSVGPIRIAVDQPMQRLSLHVDHEVVQTSLDFTARCPLIEEPRFTFPTTAAPILDYTRMTQNGTWEGSIAVEGRVQDIENVTGTRDRSWGIRPVGPKVPPRDDQVPQFFWLWTPLNFNDCCAFYHLNAHRDGTAWNQSGLIVDLLTEGHAGVLASPAEAKQATSEVEVDQHRRVTAMNLNGLPWPQREVDARSVALRPLQTFFMSGLGYDHPQWGHGIDRGTLDVGYDQMRLDSVDPADPLYRHVQVVCEAIMSEPEAEQTPRRGTGVIEQLFIGPYEPLGFE